jgi:predicted dehydrogenase
MTKVRVAVVGVGHLGRIHARLLQQLPEAELVAVVDPTAEARQAVAAECSVPGYADCRPLAGLIDAAIVAAPTRQHHAVAHALLEQGVHVFVEKPLTLNVGDADDLIAVAASRGLVLQVGHVERFNPALVALAPHVAQPKYIDAVRSGPFTCRSTDIGVVLDLMIHDIDVVLSLVDDEVASVEALGAAVLGPNEDWAQARLTFAGGCVANLFASRVAWQPQRAMQVVGRDYLATIDFGSRQARFTGRSDAVAEGQLDVTGLDAAGRAHLKDHLFSDYLPTTELVIADANPLLEEQREFISAIRGQANIGVAAEAGRRALDVAERVLVGIAAHRWDGAADGASGPRFETRAPILRGPHWAHSRRAPLSRKRAG